MIAYDFFKDNSVGKITMLFSIEDTNLFGSCFNSYCCTKWITCYDIFLETLISSYSSNYIENKKKSYKNTCDDICTVVEIGESALQNGITLK